nr:hypothetical protein NCPCFENI_00600 [Cupriavidus sp.]
MEVLEGESIKTYLVGVLDQHLDSSLVVEDHLGFEGVLTLCDLTEFD